MQFHTAPACAVPLPGPWSSGHLAALCSSCSNFFSLCCHCRSSLLSKVIIMLTFYKIVLICWLPVCMCQTLWTSRAGLLCWFCDHTGCETPENRTLQSACLRKEILECIWPQIAELVLWKRLGHHLCQVIEEGIGSLFAEVHLGQGEEAGLLLDNVTANCTWSLKPFKHLAFINQ